MSTSSAISRPEQIPKQDQDLFRYGWHQVTRHLPDGSVDIDYEPLGPDAFIDPQPGDVVIQGSLHFCCVNALYDRLELYFADDPTTGVFSDLKMLWGIPGLKAPCPDIAIVPGIRNKDASWESFDFLAEDTRPCLVIEVLSRNYADQDKRRKPPIYAGAAAAPPPRPRWRAHALGHQARAGQTPHAFMLEAVAERVESEERRRDFQEVAKQR